jgi:hypothetical protein
VLVIDLVMLPNLELNLLKRFLLKLGVVQMLQKVLHLLRLVRQPLLEQLKLVQSMLAEKLMMGLSNFHPDLSLPLFLLPLHHL